MKEIVTVLHDENVRTKFIDLNYLANAIVDDIPGSSKSMLVLENGSDDALLILRRRAQEYLEKSLRGAAVPKVNMSRKTVVASILLYANDGAKTEISEQESKLSRPSRRKISLRAENNRRGTSPS